MCSWAFLLQKWLDSYRWKGLVFSIKAFLTRSIGLGLGPRGFIYALGLFCMFLIRFPSMLIDKREAKHNVCVVTTVLLHLILMALQESMNLLRELQMWISQSRVFQLCQQLTEAFMGFWRGVVLSWLVCQCMCLVVICSKIEFRVSKAINTFE